jgi:holin-like protein
MIVAFLALIACQLAGELVRETLNLAVPGPVIGMFFLTGGLVLRKGKLDSPTMDKAIDQTAETLIRHMGLLFVPAGVGVIAEAGLLRQEWLPIFAGLIGSTVLSLAVTGLIMHWTTRPRRESRSAASLLTANAESGRQGIHHE